FKFSQFQNKLQDLYADCPDFVVPPTRFNEIKAFIDRGLEDFSISRLKEKMPWGVSVPGDDSQVMYVWFDALVNYLSTIGWPNEEKFKEWWPVVQFAGKDNVRQQSAIWQAMLMAGGVEPSKQIVIHGFITSGGVKMSKSLGNVIDPLQIIEEFGTETLRFFLAKHVSTFEDSDVTFERIKEAYNADLANGLGNLVSRIMKMAEQSGIKKQELGIKEEYEGNKELERYEIDKAIGKIWEKISTLDSFVQTNEPYKTIKTDEEKAKKDIQYLVDELFKIGLALIPFMPETAQKIQGLAREGKSPESPLFLRK
ncbi:MAG: class I tRNA ligase family protein, partial [Patescibacteria group bacterium]